MAEMTDYLEDALLNHTFRNSAYTSPTNVYLALYTAAPSDAGGGTEVANANGYAREAITFSAPSGGAVTNSNTMTFTASGGAWGTITHAAILDSGTHGAGNMLMWTDISSVVIGDGDSVTFSSSDVTVTFD